MANNDTGIKRIFATKLTEVSTTDKEGIGAIRFEGAKIYKYVQYNQGAGAIAAVAGNMTYYHGDDSYSATAAQVTSDLSDAGAAGAEIGAGVLQAVIPHLGFGWIQTKGRAVLTPALTAGVDGDPLTPTGAGDGTLDAVDTTSAATANTHVCAHALDASAKIVLLECPW